MSGIWKERAIGFCTGGAIVAVFAALVELC